MSPGASPAVRWAAAGLGSALALTVVGGVVWAVGGADESRPRLSTVQAVDAKGLSAPLPPSALALADIDHIRAVAVSRDGTRVWTAPARAAAMPPGAGGRKGVCVIFSGPYQAGTECSPAARFAREGMFAMVHADGAYSGIVVAPPTSSGVEMDDASGEGSGPVTFFRAEGRRPTIRMVFPDHTVTVSTR